MNTMQNELARGWQLHQQGNHRDAEVIYRQVLASDPNNANAWCYLGIVLHDQRRYAEAVESYRSAIRLNPSFPIALNNLGNTLRYVNEFEEADASFQKAIDLKPDYLNAYKNRGTLHVWSGRLDEGLAFYEQALKLNPNDAELHRNLGVIYLLQGRFEEGWREYRWRWQVGDLNRPFNHIPVWDGSDLSGKTILLTAEQGLGDTLNFIRFARVLQDRGARTVAYVQAPLIALLQNAPDLGTVFPNSIGLQQAVHCQCSLLDVADLLQTTSTNIPSESPYLFATENLVQYWRQRLPPTRTTFRIGIAWQGNPGHQADAFRSMPLKCFETLAEVEGVELFSLQNGYGVEQLASWSGAKPVHTFGQELDASSGAFMDTAAIMQSLDLVITSDTAIAHLAGALNVPNWIALSYVPDWRWLMDREDSPWYPSVRLFRQPKIADWGSVFQSIRAELETRVATKR